MAPKVPLATSRTGLSAASLMLSPHYPSIDLEHVVGDG